jgi:hypothetical protein
VAAEDQSTQCIERSLASLHRSASKASGCDYRNGIKQSRGFKKINAPVVVSDQRVRNPRPGLDCPGFVLKDLRIPCRHQLHSSVYEFVEILEAQINVGNVILDHEVLPILLGFIRFE